MRATASSPMRCSVSYAKKSPKTGRNFVIRSATTSASSIRIIFGFWRERSIYKKILSEASTSERDKAYALFRLVNCYAPAGNNTCGGKDVELAQRKAWHD